MAMRYYKRCPNCGKTYVFGDRSGQLFKYGSPIRVCGNCNTRFYDNDYHEMALTGCRFRDQQPGGIFKPIMIIVGIGILIWMILYCLKNNDEATLALFGLTYGFLFLVYFLPNIIGYIRERKHFDETRKELLALYEQSYNRLHDYEYVKALAHFKDKNAMELLKCMESGSQYEFAPKPFEKKSSRFTIGETYDYVPDTQNKLESYKEMLDNGYITEEEYEIKKAKLLGPL